MVARKTSPLPARVWTYGCRAPDPVVAPLVHDQLLKAHRYYNARIELERERRKRYRDRRAEFPDVSPLEVAYADVVKQLDERRTELKQARRAARKRVEVPALTREIKRLQALRKERKGVLDEARRRVSEDPRMKMFAEENNAWAVKEQKRLRKECGVYWGTYLLVERATDAAFKSLVDPEFKRWRGGGLVGVQLHHESLAAVMRGEGTMIQIDPLCIDTATEGSNRNSLGGFKSRPVKRHAYTKVRIRIGSDADKRPVWAEFPVLIHRLPPPDATLTWAWIKCTREGLRMRYELQLTIESKTFAKTSDRRGVVAVDFGWRANVKEGTRVGYAVDDLGRQIDFVVPHRLTDAIQYASHLRSVNDKIFDEARATVQEWLKATPETIPDWMRLACEHIDKWRDHRKLARVAQQYSQEVGGEALDRAWEVWKQQRLNASPKVDLYESFSSSEAIERWLRGWLEAEVKLDFLRAFWLRIWLEKDRHLYQWETDQRNKALRRRRDLYRNWAALLGSRYGTILLEAFDLRSMARNAAPEESNDKEHTHGLRTLVAPSEFRLAIRQRCVGRNRLEDVDPVDSTRECHACGHVNDAWAFPDERVQKCAGCGKEWDQDENACRVFLKRWFDEYGTEKKRKLSAKG